MEEIKMYKIRWEGQVSDYECGVLNVIEDIVKTCMECCEGDIYTSYSVSSEPVSKKVWVNIVTLGRKRQTEWQNGLKIERGWKWKSKRSRYPPSLSKIKNVSGESGERTLSNSAGF